MSRVSVCVGSRCMYCLTVHFALTCSFVLKNSVFLSFIVFVLNVVSQLLKH